MSDSYLDFRHYVGRGGVSVELKPVRATHRRYTRNWAVRFTTTRLWLGIYYTKLDALIAASHACGRSADEMRWRPEKS